MILQSRNPVVVLIVGSVLGAGAMIFLGLVATRLTFEQFQSFQRWLTSGLNWAFIFWAILYAPLKTRALSRRIAKLESLIPTASPSSGRTAIAPR